VCVCVCVCVFVCVQLTYKGWDTCHMVISGTKAAVISCSHFKFSMYLVQFFNKIGVFAHFLANTSDLNLSFVVTTGMIPLIAIIAW
jgi:predicted nucleic acid-binding Zn finger protein